MTRRVVADQAADRRARARAVPHHRLQRLSGNGLEGRDGAHGDDEGAEREGRHRSRALPDAVPRPVRLAVISGVGRGPRGGARASARRAAARAVAGAVAEPGAGEVIVEREDLGLLLCRPETGREAGWPPPELSHLGLRRVGSGRRAYRPRVPCPRAVCPGGTGPGSVTFQVAARCRRAAAAATRRSRWPAGPGSRPPRAGAPCCGPGSACRSRRPRCWPGS